MTSADQSLQIFLAGIIQGSLPTTIHGQTYRQQMGILARARFPDATIFDPFAEHPDSIGYDHDTGNRVFRELMARAGRVDLLLAYVPEASMGTAIELWNAHNSGAVVVTVSPLVENWVIKYTADRLVPDLAALAALLEGDDIPTLLQQKGR